MNYIYFSDNLNFMYERLKYERHFMYKRVDSSDSSKTVKWEQSHRFKKLPLNFVNLTEYPFIFSPGFTKYLDMDDTHTKFIIREVREEKEIKKIPKELMSAKNERAADVARRFKWVKKLDKWRDMQ